MLWVGKPRHTARTVANAFASAGPNLPFRVQHVLAGVILEAARLAVRTEVEALCPLKGHRRSDLQRRCDPQEQV
jgi:hypothetical protein